MRRSAWLVLEGRLKFLFQNDKVAKSKKSKSPRLSTIERAREESEAITKVIFFEFFDKFFFFSKAG